VWADDVASQSGAAIVDDCSRIGRSWDVDSVLKALGSAGVKVAAAGERPTIAARMRRGDLFPELLAANPFVARFYPNFQPPASSFASRPRSRRCSAGRHSWWSWCVAMPTARTSAGVPAPGNRRSRCGCRRIASSFIPGAIGDPYSSVSTAPSGRPLSGLKARPSTIFFALWRTETR